MLNLIFANFINSIKNAAPISISIDIIIGIILLILGLALSAKKFSASRAKKIAGRVCIAVSILAFLGAAFTWVFSYFIFI